MGQINLDCKFGQLLKEFSSNYKITSICEVGSWNGQGSTRCLIEGIKQNSSSPKLYSIEANEKMYNIAKSFWDTSNFDIKPLLLHGTLHKNIMPSHEVTSHKYYPKVVEHYNRYYKTDISDLEKSNVITAELPTKIDMIVLDGGEFSSYYDWDVLKTYNPKIVALDDTLVIKNSRLLDELKSLGWSVLYEGRDRNGWAILMNPSNEL